MKCLEKKAIFQICGYCVTQSTVCRFIPHICTNAHVPGYKKNAQFFIDKGINQIICYAVTCLYAHYNWAKGMDIDFNKITFPVDVDASFAKEFKLEKDYSAVSLGIRSERFSMIVDDGIVRSFQIVKDAVNDADELLKQI